MIGWAAGSVPLRLQQLNSVEDALAEEEAPHRYRRGFSLEEVSGSVTESSLFAKQCGVARAAIALPALGERRHRGSALRSAGLGGDHSYRRKSSSLSLSRWAATVAAPTFGFPEGDSSNA
jgi:hypothetical protein